MANKRKKPIIEEERMEDTTMYGEFISSFHNWTTSERQRANTKHLIEVSEINEPTYYNNKCNKCNKYNINFLECFQPK
jgi:hypothetical protein